LARTSRRCGKILKRPNSTLAGASDTQRGVCKLSVPYTKIESTVRYLGIEVDDALAIAEQVDV
jgi:hypothetical protein